MGIGISENLVFNTALFDIEKYLVLGTTRATVVPLAFASCAVELTWNCERILSCAKHRLSDGAINGEERRALVNFVVCAQAHPTGWFLLPDVPYKNGFLMRPGL